MKVKCIRQKPWEYVFKDGEALGPAFGEMVEVIRTHSRETGDPFVKVLGFELKGYWGIFEARNFE